MLLLQPRLRRRNLSPGQNQFYTSTNSLNYHKLSGKIGESSVHCLEFLSKNWKILITTTNKLEHNKGKEMLYEWKRTIQASAVKDFQEALKKIELVHLLEVEEGTMLYDTELKE